MAKKMNYMENKGLGMLIAGLLIMGNAQWTWIADWWMFVGLLFAVFGLAKLFMK